MCFIKMDAIKYSHFYLKIAKCPAMYKEVSFNQFTDSLRNLVLKIHLVLFCTMLRIAQIMKSSLQNTTFRSKSYLYFMYIYTL